MSRGSPATRKNTTALHVLKRAGTKLLEPRGKIKLLDDLVLVAWDAYASLRPSVDLSRPMPGSETVAAGTVRNGRSAERYRLPAFWQGHILDQVLPFWEKYGIDRQHGGFWVDLRRDGQLPRAEPEKSPGFQSRMVYGFSVGYGLGRVDTYRRAAEQGVHFLLSHLWDGTAGGWYRSVRPDGTLHRPEKDVTHHAYTILGLLEYHRATADPAALERATDTYELLERHAWDRVHHGYIAKCNRDWSPASTTKNLCTQLAVLGAVLSLHRITGEAAYLQRLRELATVVGSRMRDPKHGCTLENFHRSWNYHPLATRDKIEFGHALKSARLLLEVHELTRDHHDRRAATEIIEYALRHAWDFRHGGFYHFGYRNGRVATGEKIWWTETEGLPALLLMYRVGGDPRYLDFFLRLADFSFTHFVDHEYGEWFKGCHADGTVKNSDKRDAFHTVQASWYVLKMLTQGVPQQS